MTVWELLCACANIKFESECKIVIYNSETRVVLHSFNECAGSIMDKTVIFFKVVSHNSIKIMIEE